MCLQGELFSKSRIVLQLLMQIVLDPCQLGCETSLSHDVKNGNFNTQ